MTSLDDHLTANAEVLGAIRTAVTSTKLTTEFLVDMVIDAARHGAHELSSAFVHAQTSSDELLRCLDEAKQASEQLAVRLALIKTA
jgi:hypothetical protein